VNLGEAIHMAFRGLRTNRLRTALTTLGIIIGVAAVIILVALGNGMQAGFDKAFSALANQITVSQSNGTIPGGGTARNLTDLDVIALRNTAQAPNILSVTPVTEGNSVLEVGPVKRRAEITGSTPDWLTVTARDLVVGSFFTNDQDRNSAKVVVLGVEAVTNLFGPTATADTVLNRPVRIDHATFRVIGVLKSDRQQDNVAVVPIGASRSFLLGGKKIVTQIVVKSTSPATVSPAIDELTRILSTQHAIKDPTKQDFKIRALQNLLDQRSQFLTYLTLFTTAVAAISLIVGGIGVANIMLVAVTERTREIGIRKAVGANRSAILKQFLTEAVVLTTVGGLVGAIIGITVAIGGGTILGHYVPAFPQPIVSIGSVLLAMGISVLIGLVAGGYPAKRAAWLAPIDALRYE
jgi:putative ABC transport system permease protein